MGYALASHSRVLASTCRGRHDRQDSAGGSRWGAAARRDLPGRTRWAARRPPSAHRSPRRRRAPTQAEHCADCAGARWSSRPALLPGRGGWRTAPHWHRVPFAGSVAQRCRPPPGSLPSARSTACRSAAGARDGANPGAATSKAAARRILSWASPGAAAAARDREVTLAHDAFSAPDLVGDLVASAAGRRSPLSSRRRS